MCDHIPEPDDSDYMRGCWHGIIITVPLWCLLIVGIIIFIKETLGHGR